jgi:hypothetical protein
MAQALGFRQTFRSTARRGCSGADCGTGTAADQPGGAAVRPGDSPGGARRTEARLTAGNGRNARAEPHRTGGADRLLKWAISKLRSLAGCVNKTRRTWQGQPRLSPDTRPIPRWSLRATPPFAETAGGRPLGQQWQFCCHSRLARAGLFPVPP